MNLHDLFAIPRQQTPDKLSLHFRSDDLPEHTLTELTFAQLHAQVDRLAAGLQRWGLRKGDRVAFFLGQPA